MARSMSQLAERRATRARLGGPCDRQADRAQEAIHAAAAPLGATLLVDGIEPSIILHQSEIGARSVGMLPQPMFPFLHHRSQRHADLRDLPVVDVTDDL